MAMMTVHWLGLRGQRRDRDGQQQRRDREHARRRCASRTSRPSRRTPRRGCRAIRPPMRPKRVAKTPTMRVWRLPTMQAGEQVAAAAVGAEREAGLGAGDGVALRPDLVEQQPGSGVVRARCSGAKIASRMNSEGDRRADEEDRVAAQPAPGARDERDTGGSSTAPASLDGTVRDGRAAARGACARGELVDPLLLALRAQGRASGGWAPGHLVRTRGSITAYAMSTSRLTTT